MYSYTIGPKCNEHPCTHTVQISNNSVYGQVFVEALVKTYQKWPVNLLVVIAGVIASCKCS